MSVETWSANNAASNGMFKISNTKLSTVVFTTMFHSKFDALHSIASLSIPTSLD